MQSIGALFATHPQRPPDPSLIEVCATAACYECGGLCAACSDACLGEAHVADLVCCIRTCLDCSDVCLATARIVSRVTEPSPMLVEAQLMACPRLIASAGHSASKEPEIIEGEFHQHTDDDEGPAAGSDSPA
jgi:hypothetical protein